MSIVRLANVAFAYPQQSRLLTEINLTFTPGWTGIVGANGTGKSTLARIICGDLDPVEGQVDRPNFRIARCLQMGAELPDDVMDFANAWTPVAMRWMSMLELEPGDVWRWDELSPGLRRRWQIAAALASEPGLLLLDEPTNHLDVEGREVLLNALQRYDGVGIVISHDRAFLEALTTSTVRLHRMTAAHHSASYSAAKEQWEAEAAAELAELETAQARERQLRAQVSAASHRASTAAAALSSRTRMKSSQDTDGGSMARKVRAQRAEAGISKGKGVTRAAHTRAKDALADLQRPDFEGGDVVIEGGPLRREVAVRFEGDVVAGDRLLAANLTFELRRDERVQLGGPNGCGKTTFLRAMLCDVDLPPERVVFVPQSLDAAELLSEFASLEKEDRTRVLHLGAALGLEAEPILAGLRLSPGQTRKLAVALGLAKSPWLIVLDEPTNDLDLDAVERIERALDAYPGAMIVVTHDPVFAERIRAKPWRPFDE